VILEITETAFMDERVDIVPILQELHRLGYRMAIDDFGTGYSSLSCLHRFPIDLLKIDRSFIKSIEARREFTAVFAAIVSLANSLELDVVAEGVESKNQLIQLQAMDCGYGQGYLFSKPMTLECALEYIRDQGNADQDPVRHAA
jgi:EAL domain-containing protein (putative c-di-GMP-specific phosphodiesterase class I)